MRVERRANLVAHVGEERALGFGRLFGPSLRDLQLLDQLREARGLILELALARLELARVARHRFFGGLPLGDVARGGVDDLLFRERRRRPHQPAQRAVLVKVAVLEVDDFLARSISFRASAIGRLAIVGMDEVHERPRQQLRFGVAQHPLPGGVDALEVAVESGDAQHVEREREEAVELFLRAPAIDEQADLVADAREHREQIRRLARGYRG